MYLVFGKKHETADSLGFSNAKRVNQVHGDVIVTVEEIDNAEGLLNADAIITNLSKTPLLLNTADCIPILLYDSGKQVIAAIHCGWRGVINGISIKTVCKLKDVYGVNIEKINAFLGPSICGDCYDMTAESLLQFSRELLACGYKAIGPKHCMDLKACVKYQLKSIGVKSIWQSRDCTKCLSDTYWSHRYAVQTKSKAGSNCSIITL
ncbi:MAG: peptidoglycan editing factor PgeF [Endomicrobium sp.]|jgi:YfiH family protein|nr:peptidoglycan editing factor PgeF [Endomicrobium sp.]